MSQRVKGVGRWSRSRLGTPDAKETERYMQICKARVVSCRVVSCQAEVKKGGSTGAHNTMRTQSGRHGAWCEFESIIQSLNQSDLQRNLFVMTSTLR